MTENDPTDSARLVNPNATLRELIVSILFRLFDLLDAWSIRSPAIERDGIYTRQQVLANLKLTDHTLKRWCESGLRSWQAGSKQTYFRGEDILTFMESPPDLSKAYEPPHVERNQERKKGAS